MKLITISGLDGSGKSSQIEKLKKYLENQGKKVYYFHAVSFSIANKLNKNKNQKPGEAKPVVQAGPAAIFLRKIALVIDCFRFYFFFQKLSTKYNYLLSDRYFYDQIINIHYLQKTQNPSLTPWWQKAAQLFLLKPNFAFYLKVPPQIILNRKRIVEQGEKYLKAKNILYDFFFQKWSLQKIDGKESCEEVSRKIINFIENASNE